ncbi:cupin domain-containing protein [Shewanella yunxiaonensis]|uniref:Cupin domain-containing protein n=1 Tax=Shewanella yunxiaonensis TaxID=2829809 RepID=A0ABX7YS34_9GAMM|nr:MULTISPECIES: cupin domain-containing protein [Shewanella]MDF0534013.1 cupin domain-containing protein [Shewanella sp. A32]QUN05195.1 cupin domain-containing protein [Shewanella yunxiaonensis]
MNLFAGLPGQLLNEQFDAILQRPNLRIERILSQGQVTPTGQWYDQDEHEWVLVLQGAGRIQYQDGTEVVLNRGDSLDIPAHCRHRVSWTEPEQLTVWLAVFYR